VIEEEHSPIIDIVGDMPNAPLPEALMASSSSDASSGGAASDVAEIEAEDVVDPREHEQCYDFGASSVIVGRIQQLESLRYFAEGSEHEPGEETIPVPNTNEDVVLKSFSW
jgi:hypothetical protein